MPDFITLCRRLELAMWRMLDQNRSGDAGRLVRRWGQWQERQLSIYEREADYAYNRLTR